MVDRVDRWSTQIPDIAGLENCYSWEQWLPFGKEINFVTKYLATMLLKYAGEFPCYLVTSHTRASKSKQSCKTFKK